MSYRVRMQPSVSHKISALGLPDFLIVDIHLRLHELADHAIELLERSVRPFDGMLFRFSVVDPSVRTTEHFCYFHVLFSQDEEFLLVINFDYVRHST